MDFPIIDLLDDEVSTIWLHQYMHVGGLKCPHCQASTTAARVFRQTRKSNLDVYRCSQCQGIYTVYSGTVFQGKQLRPAQVVLLLRGVCKGEPTQPLARELGLSRPTVHQLRHALQRNAERLQPDTPLRDRQTETDEMFQNAGEKRRKTRGSKRSAPPPREQAQGARHLRQ